MVVLIIMHGALILIGLALLCWWLRPAKSRCLEMMALGCLVPVIASPVTAAIWKLGEILGVETLVRYPAVYAVLVLTVLVLLPAAWLVHETRRDRRGAEGLEGLRKEIRSAMSYAPAPGIAASSEKKNGVEKRERGRRRVLDPVRLPRRVKTGTTRRIGW